MTLVDLFRDMLDAVSRGLERMSRLGEPAPRTYPTLASGGLINRPTMVDDAGCLIPTRPRYGTIMHVGTGGLEPLGNVPLSRADLPELVVPLRNEGRKLQPPGDRIADAIRDQRFYRDQHPATPDTFYAGMKHAEQIARGLR